MIAVATVYVFPLNGAGQFFDLALRFIESYQLNPPGMEHQMVVVCNGAPATEEAKVLFSIIPNCTFLEHDNSGFDCGAYQKASREIPADLMVFFGATAYVRGPGWLVRMVDAWKKKGDTLYGAMGNRGDGRVNVQPHIRTSGFWLSPSLFNQYPHQVTRPEHRYEMEHGATCLTTWIRNRRLTPYVVGWQGEYAWERWDSMGGYHQGNQFNLIAGDRMSRAPYGSDP